MTRNRKARPTRATALRGSTLLLGIALALSACGKGEDRAGPQGDGADPDSLPRPAVTSGSVTGMPDAPGPGQVGVQTVDLPSDATAQGDDGDGSAAQAGVEGIGTSPASEDVDADAGEPTPQDAVAVVRDYYAAINSGSFGRAYALWSDGGSASGQSPQQFADGFADTTGVSVQIDAPGPVGAAAGSRYIEIPVAIEAKQRDGGLRRFVGAYVLRRALVDGASAEQRQWRITSADIREVRP